MLHIEEDQIFLSRVQIISIK